MGCPPHSYSQHYVPLVSHPNQLREVKNPAYKAGLLKTLKQFQLLAMRLVTMIFHVTLDYGTSFRFPVAG